LESSDEEAREELRVHEIQLVGKAAQDQQLLYHVMSSLPTYASSDANGFPEFD